MPRVLLTTNSQAATGFSVVEVLLAAAVFGVLVTGLIGALVYGRASTASSGDRMRAHLLAEEGAEAARNIGTNSFATLVNGTYGLAVSSGQYIFSGTSDTTGIFTRSIVVTTPSTNRRTVAVTVTWPQQVGTASTTVITELVNWPAAIKLWSAGIVSGTLDITGTNDGLKVDTQGNYAYMVLNIATTNNFAIVDISNPAAPTLKSLNSITGTPTNIMVSGGYAYITNQVDTAELQVFDVANPSTATLKASVNLTGSGNGQGVFINGTKAYVVRAADATASANEFNVIDISNPLSPVVNGGYNNDISMNEVWVSGTNAFVATSSTTQEMLVVNAATPTAPTLTVAYNPTTPNLAATSITGFGNTVFLTMSTTLDAVNVTTPSAPARLGTFTAAGAIGDVDVDITGQFAFLATASTTGEFQIVNVGTPATMTLSKTVDVNGTTSTVGGVSYDPALDIVAGSSIHDTQELQVFTRN